MAADCIPTTTWTDSNGSWFVAGKWNNGVPNAGTSAYINNAGTANISSTGAAACNLTLGYDAVDSGTVSVNGGSLTVTNEVEVGAYGEGTLTITNQGNVTAGLLTIAALQNVSGSPSIGTVTVDGSTVTVTTRLDVGGDNGTPGGIALLSVTNSGTVSAANVHVYKSGTLTGNGTVTTTNGTTIEGTIEPSGGRLTIGGNLTFFGTAPLMESNVVPASADNVYVSNGAASLTGRLKVTMTGTFTPGTTYTLLHADNGLGNTKFSSVSITFPPGQGWSPVIIYDTNNVKLNLAATTGP